MPIAHAPLPASSLEDSTAFYLTALAPLGYSTFMQLGNTTGLNAEYDGPDFWLHKCPKSDAAKPWKTHVAFKGKSKKAVREFHAAALKAGGRVNGAPGERPHYTKGYYAAYVLDLDGNTIECVYYQPWWLSAVQIASKVLGLLAVGGVAWWVGKGGFV
ncbi:hypothetical protein LSUE1_G001230 [Lachnellula suecica]|uniref:VOC domain-containing protein n=1 Tax=Lachnellula suecica TaxID=602035 RepID=A0A8T9CIJ5_9HELO|nr:hypothetical protein LSUE1_G001230 [Lachnellula suecica]